MALSNRNGQLLVLGGPNLSVMAIRTAGRNDSLFQLERDVRTGIGVRHPARRPRRCWRSRAALTHANGEKLAWPG